jgi:hypothetical protein
MITSPGESGDTRIMFLEIGNKSLRSGSGLPYTGTGFAPSSKLFTPAPCVFGLGAFVCSGAAR